MCYAHAADFEEPSFDPDGDWMCGSSPHGESAEARERNSGFFSTVDLQPQAQTQLQQQQTLLQQQATPAVNWPAAPTDLQPGSIRTRAGPKLSAT
eukprot:scaffold74425_cov17-Tisochrysis_lutea.AAC.1